MSRSHLIVAKWSLVALNKGGTRGIFPDAPLSDAASDIPTAHPRGHSAVRHRFNPQLDMPGKGTMGTYRCGVGPDRSHIRSGSAPTMRSATSLG